MKTQADYKHGKKSKSNINDPKRVYAAKCRKVVWEVKTYIAYCELRSSNGVLPLPIIHFSIVAYAFMFL